ncbi:MAG: aminoacyl-tRNA hydrolase [Candidatus Lloydbacteria bacterium CG22_combo_CG10-13_8_21_14_all_47_15]|uniref:Aminoacyl-tRNA hydrolase n=1 Tax=Candidatus Lloydbacteria bacterium CG22_combo_CG10-13_8_21_14_all_47_15 TaxID=1974635 RepID=A0A2H0CVF9_9BACT|nr:MAG: aminoacyl-tRNA hydrolase [Candidatus Lloydbacteria bacterium CG22_combo_CG10-13_8_21_14_all_47_15]
MAYIFVGLGNPGEEYANSRHNTGRMILYAFQKRHEFSNWEYDKKLQALVSKGKVEKTPVILLLPETFMNKSGVSVARTVTNAKKAEHLVVVYDDIDLPFGTLKISYDRSSGGHRGLESVIRTLGTKKFIRLRVGVSPKTPAGKIKKPQGDEKVVSFLMSPFGSKDTAELSRVKRRAVEALQNISSKGRVYAASVL